MIENTRELRLLQYALAYAVANIDEAMADDLQADCDGLEKELTALRDKANAGQTETMSGQNVYVSQDGSTLYVAIPRELAADIPGGCDCPYCKKHPDITPKWDTLALAAKPKGDTAEHSWTVHCPDRGALKLWGWK
jgi:hypothetical protein